MKYKIFFSILIALTISSQLKAQVKIGDNPTIINSNALFEMESSSKGLLIPRMTSAQRSLIFPTPASDGEGLLVYQTNESKGFYYYNGSIWTHIGSGSETDPVFLASIAYGITSTDILNWNNSFAWGNHSGMYRPIGYVPGWSEITGKPNFATVATTGNYSDLNNKPNMLDSITSKSVLLYGNQIVAGNKVFNDTLTGKINAKNATVSNVANPVNNNDAATKAYVDAIKQELRLEIYAEMGVTDIDANHYNAVKIGNQVWMKENLKVTKYRNGELIGTTTPATLDLSSEATPKYQWAYAGNDSNVATYGRLYTWYAVTDSRKVCPVAWHVPTENDFTTLINYLGGAGSKLKEAGTIHWYTPNTGATNETGFTALPGGIRSYNGTFYDINLFGCWQNSTEFNYYNAWVIFLSYNDSNIHKDNYGKKNGHSLRCLRDDPSQTSVLPIINTNNVSNITQNTASCGGNISSDGGSSVLNRGVCWSTATASPVVSDSHTTDGTGTGAFTSSMTGLTPNRTHYVRAYASNIVGTAYGYPIEFLTPQLIITTNTVSNITANSASCGGNISSDGGSFITARGVCWSLQQNPLVTDNHTINGTSIGTFTSSLSGLTGNTTYYVRAYATNSLGTFYGSQRSFIFNTFTCSDNLTISHIAGIVAPVSKTVTYSTALTTLFGGSKCVITQNLGADHQADSTYDATEASAGWYWQFNRKQGFKHDGTIRTPSTTWIAAIDENSNWTAANDPCSAELGSGWHIPTNTEWETASDLWTDYPDAFNTILKLHAAGLIFNGSLYSRGEDGYYWSSTQSESSKGYIDFFSFASKSYGISIRCLRNF